tara:strand:+ start:438 stop:1559 length:1122 start_codon:yes stop_codon:yes gene_type:complete
MKKKILIVGLSNLSRAARPLTQIKALKDSYLVDTIGLKPSHLEHNFYKIKKESILQKILTLPLLLLRLYNFYYWDKNKKSILKKIKNNKYDLIIVHEVRMLPLVFEFSKDAKVILDAHEYSPANFNDRFVWRIFIKHFYIYLCHKYLKKCDQIITISDSYAKLYKKSFNVDCHVVNNAAEYFDLEPYSLDCDKIKIIHHGNASPSRKLELLIEMMETLDSRFELYFMLVAKRTHKLYLNKLKKKAAKYANIHFLDPVPYEDLIEYSNQFDIGILFFPPVNLNLEVCLPNKLFEFIQSRLCVVSGPSIEIKKYIETYNLGFVSDSFEPKNMAKHLNLLTKEDIINYKNNSNYNAYPLSSEANKEKISNIVKGLI